MSIINPDNVVTKQDLADFYQNLLPYLGGMPEFVCNKFNKSDLYSTTEKVVGCWTNNKPLYQKTISCGNLPNNTTKTVAHGISNIDAIIDTNFVFGDDNSSAMSNGSFASIPGNNSDLVGVWVDKTYISIKTMTNRSSFSGYCTLRYTKTTDAANSFNYASENDYSTNETIIGTWIDGSNLYQRTYTGTLPTGTTGTTLQHTIGYLPYEPINFEGYIKTAAGNVLSCNNADGVYFYKRGDTGHTDLLIQVIPTNAGTYSKATYAVTVKYTKS